MPARSWFTTAPTSSLTAGRHSRTTRWPTPSPQSTYAASKLLGEWFALDAPRAYVLRVESLFGAADGWTGRSGTLDNIVAGIEAGRDVRVFTDRVVSPSYVPDIAAATRHLVADRRATRPVSLRERWSGNVVRGCARRGGAAPA